MAGNSSDFGEYVDRNGTIDNTLLMMPEFTLKESTVYLAVGVVCSALTVITITVLLIYIIRTLRGHNYSVKIPTQQYELSCLDISEYRSPRTREQFHKFNIDSFYSEEDGPASPDSVFTHSPKIAHHAYNVQKPGSPVDHSMLYINMKGSNRKKSRSASLSESIANQHKYVNASETMHIANSTHQSVSGDSKSMSRNIARQVSMEARRDRYENVEGTKPAIKKRITTGQMLPFQNELSNLLNQDRVRSSEYARTDVVGHGQPGLRNGQPPQLVNTNAHGLEYSYVDPRLHNYSEGDYTELAE